jgi:alpha-tubulin suppressor-like RCC1 family protein
MRSTVRRAVVLGTATTLVLWACGEDEQLSPTQPVAPASVTPSASITTTTPRFGTILARDHNTCALSSAGAAYCWGLGVTGELGDGRTTQGQRVLPRRVLGGLSFAALGSGGSDSCGITASGAAYCWGWNLEGELGIGNTNGPQWCALFTGYLAPCSSVPVAVVGGLRFTSVSIGGTHTCALIATGSAYCWGNNSAGQLGRGSTTGPQTCPRSDISEIVPCSTRPVRVRGGLTFTSISAGGTHTCGVTAGGAAYCWGSGTMGNGSTAMTPQTTPVLVAGGLTFASLSTSDSHTCGVTTAGVAYCWGTNLLGALGDGTGRYQATPVRVSGGLRFTMISAGDQYTCGVRRSGAAYCWGHGEQGQLGGGITNTYFTPQPVAGGLLFSTVSAGSTHTCGIATSGPAYCWGRNDNGKLGDGTTTQRLTPVQVGGP